MSFLPPGSNIVITGGSFNLVESNNATKVLKPLYKSVAPNAILNAGGRVGPVRCHPGTREEVIEKMEKRIADTGASHRGVLWLSGPAGAGKSAIMQTVAERCIERKVPMVNFFFFRADSTRNHWGSIVPTLLYQLFNLFPSLKEYISAIASQNPIIFQQSMREQFSTLIEGPLLAIKASSENTPVVILIDGLDECSSGNGKDDQIALLHILHDIATRSFSPAFTVIVASRTEPHLTMVFNEIGSHSDSIYLDESYRPANDIHLFLTQEFSRIKRTHSLGHTLPASWPLSADLDAIVEKSSGQFVYAATVVRFLSSLAASPKRGLEIVLRLRPATRTSPFSTIDSLYMHILSQTEDWSSVRDILAAQRIMRPMTTLQFHKLTLSSILGPLGYTEDDILSSLSDLTAIVRFCAGDERLTIYHASLEDFLYDQHRAGNFYIDINTFACKLAPPYFKQIPHSNELDYGFQILQSVTEPDEQLTGFLKSFLPDYTVCKMGPTPLHWRQNWIKILVRLYQSRDPELCENMVIRWQEWYY